MLPSQNRLDKKTIVKILKQGRGFFSDNMTLKTLSSNEKENRFAFIIQSGTAKKAVERNKIKRRARNIVKDLLPAIKNKKTGLDSVLFFKKSVKGKKFREMSEEISALLKKAGIL